MILDYHQVARAIRFVHRARCVGDHQLLYAEQFEDPNRQRAALRRIALVRMKSALHADHRIGGAPAEHQLTRMAGHRAVAEVRNLLVANGDRIFQRARQTAQTGTADDRKPRLYLADSALDELSALLNLFERVAVTRGRSGYRACKTNLGFRPRTSLWWLKAV